MSDPVPVPEESTPTEQQPSELADKNVGTWIFPKLVKILDNAIKGLQNLDDETLKLFAANVGRLTADEKLQLYSNYGSFLEMQLATISIAVEKELVPDEMIREVLYGSKKSPSSHSIEDELTPISSSSCDIRVPDLLSTEEASSSLSLSNNGKLTPPISSEEEKENGAGSRREVEKEPVENSSDDVILLESNDIGAFLDKLKSIPKPAAGSGTRVKVRLRQSIDMNDFFNMFKFYEFVKSKRLFNFKKIIYRRKILIF